MNKETIGTTLAGAVIGSALAGIPGLIIGAAALCISASSSSHERRSSWPPIPSDMSGRRR